MIYSEDRSTQRDASSSAGASSLSDLIARLEKATGADRELDAAIALAVGTYRISKNGKSIWDVRTDSGGQFVIGRSQPDQSEPYSPEEAARLLSTTIGLPRYTESIDAAMTLGAFPIHEMGHLKPDKVHWYVVLGDPLMSQSRHAVPAIAICIANLKALSQIESLPANDSAETRLEI